LAQGSQGWPRSPQGCRPRAGPLRAVARAGPRPMGGDGRGAATASQPVLPSVVSSYPLRRVVSLSSRQTGDAAKAWQETLHRRVGVPGDPPGRDTLPSLYDKQRRTIAASGVSRSAPPSTVGPSASVVAWFAQFQCQSCERIPTSLEDRFCSSCGQPLPLPQLPPGTGGGRSGCTAANLGEVAAAAAAAAERAARRPAAMSAGGPPATSGGGSAAEPVKALSDGAVGAGAVGPAARQTLRHAGARRGPDRGKKLWPSSESPGRRPRRGDEPKAGWLPEKSMKTREGQVAVWLGNIKPRR